MALHYVPENVNKQYVSLSKRAKIKTFLERIVVTVKWTPEQRRQKSENKLYGNERWQRASVMFIIRRLFRAITCNKLIISVTLALNYMSNDEQEEWKRIRRQNSKRRVFMTRVRREGIES